MQNTTEKSSRSAEGLYKFFIYFVLVLLAVTIIVPVAWVFMASIKQNAEFYGNPWALPAGFYWQNFVNAWNGAKMGEYMLNSVIVTALALALLLVVALPAAYCLSRFRFKGCKATEHPVHGGPVHQRELHRGAHLFDAAGQRCVAEKAISAAAFC